MDTQTIGEVADLGVTAGRLADVSGPRWPSRTARPTPTGSRSATPLEVTFARTGPVELTIRALIDRPPPGFDGVVYLVDLDTYEANVTDQFDRQVFVKVADGVSPTQAEAALDTVLADGPTVSCRTRPHSRRPSPARSTSSST